MKFKVLTYNNQFIDESYLFNGIYTTTHPTLLDADLTMEKFISEMVAFYNEFDGGAIDVSVFLHNLEQCELVTYELSEVKNEFSYPYYYYGSEDSKDIDILFSVSREEMPHTQEERKVLVKQIENDFFNFCGKKVNGNLVVIENGYIVDTIYPKAWVDGVNNSLYNTYSLHKQDYPLPVIGKLKRNKLLAIYKTARTIMALLSRTQYRSKIKATIKGFHPFEDKLKVLDNIDFMYITSFNQKNMCDVDILKTITFYLGQNIQLVANNEEIYTKTQFNKFYPKLYNFIYRKELVLLDKLDLTFLLTEWIELVRNYGEYKLDGHILSCNGEVINTKNETTINEIQSIYL